MTNCEMMLTMSDKAEDLAIKLRRVKEYDLSSFWKNVSVAWRKRLLDMSIEDCARNAV